MLDRRDTEILLHEWQLESSQEELAQTLPYRSPLQPFNLLTHYQHFVEQMAEG
jgi:hypothetical protein